MARHAVPHENPRGAMALSRRSGWQRVRRTLTAGVFLVSTVAGVTVGLHGATVSPGVVDPGAADVAAGASAVPPAALTGADLVDDPGRPGHAATGLHQAGPRGGGTRGRGRRG